MNKVEMDGVYANNVVVDNGILNGDSEWSNHQWCNTGWWW